MKPRRARAAREVPEIRRSADTLGLHGPTSSGNWFVCCPFCRERVRRVDGEFKLTIRISGELAEQDGKPAVDLTPERGIWNCYRCNARGFADFRWMLSFVGPVGAGPVQEEIDLGPPEGFVPVSECERSVTMGWVPEYFAARGVLEAARAVGAGGCARGHYAGRVVVPFVARPGGDWLGFSARFVGAAPYRPKYLYPRGMDRRRALWGTAWLPPAGTHYEVWIVEGVFDALPLFPHSVATLGSEVTEEQVDALVALKRRLVPCLDGDAWLKGRALAQRLLMKGGDVRGFVHMPSGLDPGTLGWKVREYFEPIA